MSSGPARLAYLGTSDFAATILRRLAAGVIEARAGRHPAGPQARARTQACAASGGDDGG